MSEQGDDKGFVVKDRRRFDAEGATRSDANAARAEPEPADQTASTGAASQPLPGIDFSTFILSLSTSVMVHLGEAPDPTGAERNLELAKQTIDILGLLQEKTRNNLTDDETKLMDELLYDLRLRFVSARGG